MEGFGRDEGAGRDIAREEAALRQFAGLNPQMLFSALRGVLNYHPGVFVPGWPAVIVAIEMDTENRPNWYAFTDMGDAVLVEPSLRTATSSLGGPVDWPLTTRGIVPVEAEPDPDTDRGYDDDDDGNGNGNGNGNGAPAPIPLGMIAAAAAAAFLLLGRK